MQCGTENVQSGPKVQYFLLRMRVFRFKPTCQFVEKYPNVANCALKMDDLISKNVCKIDKELNKSSYTHF
jgi:hypothetical protein